MVKVAVIMGSKSDYATMVETCQLLDQFGIPYDKKVVSAHRTPDLLVSFAKGARQAGYSLIIAAAGGAAHLPGMVASMTTLPVIASSKCPMACLSTPWPLEWPGQKMLPSVPLLC